MLAYLSVRNFALVAELELEFNSGLTVITGESGAGKSILLGALGMVLGQRMSKALIRPGAEACEVSAEFNLENVPDAQALLRSRNLLDQDDEQRCIVRRRTTPDGRSRAWINSVPATVTDLRELCSSLVEIHGQFEQQQLMSPAVQLSWLDDYIANSELLAKVQTAFHSWRKAAQSHDALKQQQDRANERRDLLEFQLNELNAINLSENEFEQLSTRFKRISQTETILETIHECLQQLDEVGAPAVGQAKAALARLDDNNAELGSAGTLLEGVEVGLEESLGALRRYAESLTLDQESAKQVSARLDAVHEIARKHRVQGSELYATWQRLLRDREELETADTNLQQAEETKKAAQQEFLAHAKSLSEQRRAAAKPFSKDILRTLSEIGMKDSAFELAFHNAQSAHGLEGLEYLVSANSHYKPGPLKSIASGGELSRISLAILVVVAARSQLPCLILDEADIGVGGTTADDVGRMLRQLASHTQVICVTHAPQVAALGSTHFGVRKTQSQDICVECLSNKARIEEVARMVGGQTINTDSRNYAAVLLKAAQDTNNSPPS